MASPPHLQAEGSTHPTGLRHRLARLGQAGLATTILSINFQAEALNITDRAGFVLERDASSATLPGDEAAGTYSSSATFVGEITGYAHTCLLEALI